MIAPAGRRLGKYEIRQKLGRGGMADVYLAEDSRIGRLVALKLIEHSEDSDTRDSIEAERRGAGLQAQLADVDSHVAKIFETGDLDGFFYVAMEYVEGRDLSEVMRGGPLGAETASDNAIAVAETLEHAHTLVFNIDGKEFHGIVHGDIKPKNIRIDSRGNVRVLDFGIAKALSLSRRLTRNEFGSVPYASPERLDSGQVDVGSDLWSLAVMLYEMVTGLQPYHAATTERLESMIRSRIPPPPAPDPCPEPLRRIMMKAMAAEPEMRYRSALEFGDDLKAFRGGGTVQAEREDMDATRRTSRREVSDETRRTTPLAAGASEETRRTAPIPPPLPSQIPRPLPATAAGKAAAPLSRRWFGGKHGTMARIVAATVVAILAWAIYGAGSSMLRYERGRTLARQIETEQLTDPDQIWARWTELSKGSNSSLALWGPRKLVKQKMEEAADRVIATYRSNESQPVYEKDWVAARNDLNHALALDPDDSIRGKLRLCEGHITRIEATAHRSTAEMNDAIDKFNDARRLLPKSPDPDLGLARVYVYGLKDIDKAEAALKDAQKLGYQLGVREKLHLADGYRERADRTWWDTRNVRGLPQERDQILRSAADYHKALDLYQEISPAGNAGTYIARIQTSLDSVNARLQQIDGGQPSEGHTAATLSDVLRRVAGAIVGATKDKGDKAPTR